MRNVTLFLALIASLCLVSCDKEQHDENKTTVDTFPLTVSLSKSSLVEGSFELDSQSQSMSLTSSSTTRIGHESGTNVFVVGDDIGLYAVEYTGVYSAYGTTEVKGALESSGNIINNHEYTYTSSSSWNASSLTNPLTWRSVSLYAYHPYNGAVNTTDAKALTFTQRVNQGAPIISSLDYLMYGFGAQNSTGYKPTDASFPTTGAVIEFSHKTAVVKLDVTLRGEYAGKEIKSVDKATVLSVPSTAIMNLENGVVTYKKGADNKLITVDVVMEKTAGTTLLKATFEAVVLPTTYTVGASVIKIDYTNVDSSTGAFYLYATAKVSSLSAQSIYAFSATLAPEFCFVTASVDAPSAGLLNSKFVVRSSNPAITWTVKSGVESASWITVSKTSGSGWAASITGKSTSSLSDTEAYIKVAPNTDDQPRLGKLILSAEGADETKNIELLIMQEGVE